MCENQIPHEVPVNPVKGGWGVLVSSLLAGLAGLGAGAVVVGLVSLGKRLRGPRAA